ncbi:MAG: hypothetical protein LAT67_03770 [Balneolales bacterium]|nr:hypothetical protein [Balneolales bacterium]
MNTKELKSFFLLSVGGLAVILLGLLLSALLVNHGFETSFVQDFGFYILISFGFLATCFTAFLYWLFTSVFQPLNRLADALDAFKSNPEISGLDSFFTRKLGKSASFLLKSYTKLSKDSEMLAQDSRKKAEMDKETLTSLISELQSGVLLCNSSFRITLFNPKAASILKYVERRTKISLGRHLNAVLDKDFTSYLSGKLLDTRNGKHHTKTISGLHYAPNGNPISVHLILTNPDSEPGSYIYVIIIRNIAGEIEKAERRDRDLNELRNITRSSTANIRAAAETIAEYDEMSADVKKSLISVIHDETIRLGEAASISSNTPQEGFHPAWPVQHILIPNLLEDVGRSLKSGDQPVTLELKGKELASFIKGDAFALTSSLVYIIRRFAEKADSTLLYVSIFAEDRLLTLRFSTSRKILNQDKSGSQFSLETIIQNQPLLNNSPYPHSIHYILEQHQAEILSSENDTEAWVSVIFPAATNTAETNKADEGKHLNAQLLKSESRPVYYDFDLIGQGFTTNKQLGDKTLKELNLTVFDLETTGLNPSVGDEIISIGAVRVVNAKLYKEDTFYELVKPERKVPDASIEIHGITNLMLENKPGLMEILPHFHGYCEDSVLVGHNVAFDLRFLEMASKKTSLSFKHPILDTLLLSSVLYEDADSHKLDALCKKFGIQIDGRHTALGDAVATAEALIYLIDFLASNGIYTLNQAQELSKKSRFTQLIY